MTSDSALGEIFRVLVVKLDVSIFLCLLYALFSVDCWQSYICFLVSENEIWDGPFLPTFIKHGLLSDLEQIGLFEHNINNRAGKFHFSFLLSNQIEQLLLLVVRFSCLVL